MDIPKIIKEHHQAMIDKGFYICPECEKGNPGQIFRYGEYMDCPNCDGSNINPNKNIGELLMLIVTELSEALEAHRTNHFCSEHILDKAIFYQERDGKFESYFENCVKNSFEDEFADINLRLFDLCGYIIPEENYENLQVIYDQKCSSYPDGIGNIGQWLFSISMQLGEISHMHYKNIIPLGSIGNVLSNLKKGCEILNIPIEKHIIAKMAYNKTRPHKHNKEY